MITYPCPDIRLTVSVKEDGIYWFNLYLCNIPIHLYLIMQWTPPYMWQAFRLAGIFGHYQALASSESPLATTSTSNLSHLQQELQLGKTSHIFFLNISVWINTIIQLTLKLMAQYKRGATPLLTHWNYVFFHQTIKIRWCSLEKRCNMAFIEPMHRNKPNVTYLLTSLENNSLLSKLNNQNSMG